ncbi:aryl hydrocarbon receptor nuclear translocator-like protein 2 isoform X7 [Syngnathus acus]|uniref:aryl hydrocarbon receptor nuclear translocator-like protein 2 isoform X7 n=1 Tax=Syngnathus acus TaxID=161584 RepID=UPI0018862777|nr:aryl hydrocarbon receptor nuclear translocator-like protein 2 isoform X7 [Syngnathus acus]
MKSIIQVAGFSRLPPLSLGSSTCAAVHRKAFTRTSAMSDGGSGGTADRLAGRNAEEEGPSQANTLPPAGELPRKRKGDVEDTLDALVHQSLDFQMDEDLDRSEDDQQAKMKCFSHSRQPHRQIEKRRRDKMNNLIDELAAMIPACQPMPRKLDKLTVLRKAVQHLKALKAGSSSAFAAAARKPSIIPHDDLRHLLLWVADGFLLVVSCDRGKILFISESVSKILSFSRVELTGQSLFDLIHPKDISKVKEQLSSSDLNPHQRLIDAATGVPVHEDAPVTASHLSTGARRSFFCRMKHNRVEAKHKDKRILPTASIKKDSSRYCTLHCTGYMRSWPRSDLDSEPGDTEKEASGLSCLVTMCRVQGHVSRQPHKDVKVKPTEFVTRCAVDGKFTFVEQQATTVIGYLPQEILGTSCYEYFHQDDLQHLAEKHRQVLRSKEKLETMCYKFKTKYGPYVSLQSQWFSFTNPWTKEVEFVVSLNRVVPRGPSHAKDDEAEGSSKAPHEESKQLPVIPGLTSGVGKMIYAGSIGTQIANELIDSYRANSSPSSGVSSPFGAAQSVSESPQASGSLSSREEDAGSSSELKIEAVPSVLESAGELSQQDLDTMLVPGLSSFSNDEAAMAVIMSLLETDVNMGQSGDFDDLHWPF